MRPVETARRSALILFSGGADSVLMAIMAWKMRRSIDILAFKYGQKHEREIDSALAILRKLDGQDGHTPKLRIRNVTVMPLKEPFTETDSALLADSVDDPEYPGVHKMHVPARNAVFLSTALGVAESNGHDEVWFGADLSDRLNLFPDCYQEWVVKMRDLALHNGSRPIEIVAPLLGLTKEHVKELLVAEGIDLGDVFSGYEAPQAAK